MKGSATGGLLGALSHVIWMLRGRTGSSAIIQTFTTKIAILAINLLNGVICARNLGPSGRGEQAAMLLWPQLLCFILTLGIPYSVIYEVRKDSDNRDTIYSSALALSFGLGCVSTIVGILFIPIWLRAYDAHAILLAQWLMIFGPQIMITLTMSAILESTFDFATSNALRYGPPFMTLLGLCVLAISHRFTPFGSALAYAVPTAVLSLIVLPKVTRLFHFTLRGFQAATKRLLSFGLRIYGSDILTTFGTQVDQMLVVGLLTPSNLGTYTVALSTSRVLNIFQTSVRIVLLPKTAGLPTAEVVETVSRAARVSTALTAVSGVGLVALLPLVLPKLYGHDFLAAVIVSQILTVESVIASTVGVLMQSFTATNRPGVATFLQGLGLAIAVPMMLVLIPRLGLIGAALSLLASTSVRLVISLVCYPALLHVKVPGLLLTRGDVLFVKSRLASRGAAAAT